MTEKQRRLPSVGDLVIANVSKIERFGAYCKLPEYDNLEVFLPIREVSSGWIKNIREFIHDGEKLVCRVALYDKERNTIDVSLKKVSSKETKEKLGAYNLENRLVALFRQAVTTSKVSPEQLHEIVMSEFGSYTSMMRSLIDNTEASQKSALPKKLRTTLLKLYEANKPVKKYEVAYTMTLSSYNTRTGAQDLRGIITAMKEKGVAIKYISAPKYRLMAGGTDYADAESKIKSAVQIAEGIKKGTFAIEKEKHKKAKESAIGEL